MITAKKVLENVKPEYKFLVQHKSGRWRTYFRHSVEWQPLNAKQVDNVQAPSLTKEINQLKDLLKQCIPAVKFAKDEGLAYMINKALNGESEGK